MSLHSRNIYIYIYIIMKRIRRKGISTLLLYCLRMILILKIDLLASCVSRTYLYHMYKTINSYIEEGIVNSCTGDALDFEFDLLPLASCFVERRIRWLWAYYIEVSSPLRSLYHIPMHVCKYACIIGTCTIHRRRNTMLWIWVS